MKLVKFNDPMNYPMTFSDIFDDFFTSSLNKAQKNLTPSVNIVENEKDYVIEVAVPGKDKDDFKIALNNDVLTISTEKKDEKCDKTKNYIRQEFCYCAFERSFNLSDDIDQDKIDAKYENGMLEVILPKREVTVNAKNKSIAIK
ncbi:MAG: Hsp20/alpha crystallin family protein [Bacteroidales bacterium]|nr:Hsp20/alpha crystallin family protein [Bacteroidales bacterium]